MDTFGPLGGLEFRKRGSFAVLAGSFPYGRQATIRDRGRIRKERIKGNAFAWQLEEFKMLQAELGQAIESAVDKARIQILEEQLSRRNVHVLSGHSYDKPLGDLKNGTARITSTEQALDFEVDLPSEGDMPSYMLDTVKEIRNSRAGGVSPGFSVPPKGVAPNAEELIPEPENPGVMIRQVNEAILY